MKKYTQFLLKEFRIHASWNLTWTGIMFLIMLLFDQLYPGKENMKFFNSFLDNPNFKALLGIKDTLPAEFVLWVAMLLGFYVLIFYIYGFHLAPRIFTYTIEQNYDEITLSFPINRPIFFILRLLESMTWLLFFNVLGLFPLLLPVKGERLPLESFTVLLIGLVSASYMLFSMGLLTSMFIPKTGRIQQLGLLLILTLYILQVIERQNTSFQDLHGYNPLNWFDPVTTLFHSSLDQSSMQKIILTSLILSFLAFLLFLKRDLTPNSALPLLPHTIQIRVNAFTKQCTRLSRKVLDALGILLVPVHAVKSIGKRLRITKYLYPNIFVFWAKPLKQKLPVTTEFLLSETKVLQIMFWVTVLMYPLQFVFYEPQTTIEIMQLSSGGMSSILKMMFYMHINDVTDTYLFYTISQAYGGTPLFMVPLLFYWSKKITHHDLNDQTGELIGVYPIKQSSIIYQRLLAVLLELTELVILIILMVYLTHMKIGEMKYMKWEVIVTVLMIPFYFMLLLFMVAINLSLPKQGTKLSRGLLLLSYVWFILATIRFMEYKWYKLGLFGMYDPVLILIKHNINIPKNALLIEIVNSFVILLLLPKISSNMKFIQAE